LQKMLDELKIDPFQDTEFSPGHNACPGCGSTMALRIVLDAMSGTPAVFFVPASCGSLYFGPSDTTPVHFPVIHTIFAGAFAQAEGMGWALARRGRPERVAVWAGDGACYDIGMGGLSGIAARNANVLVFCNNNEGYQNTGGHESSATPAGSGGAGVSISDGTLPQPPTVRKDLAEILAAHRAPYVATASAAFPDDLSAKVKTALSITGFRLILLMTPCVTWKYETRYSVRLARLAVETGYHPLYEVRDGKTWSITYEPQRRPLEEFTRLQGRFKGVALDAIRDEIEEKWEDLHFKASRPATFRGATRSEPVERNCS